MESFRMERLLKILESSCYPTTAKACSQVPHLLNPAGVGIGDHAGLERDTSFGWQSRKSGVKHDLSPGSSQGMALLHGWLIEGEGFMCSLGDWLLQRHERSASQRSVKHLSGKSVLHLFQARDKCEEGTSSHSSWSWLKSLISKNVVAGDGPWRTGAYLRPLTSNLR